MPQFFPRPVVGINWNIIFPWLGDLSQNDFEDKDPMGDKIEEYVFDASVDNNEDLEFNPFHHQGPFAYY